MMALRGLRPHDLVRLRSRQALEVPGVPALPRWARDVLRGPGGPWAVVRRDATDSPLVPLGIRGAERNQRWAVVADRASIDEVVRPFDVILRPRPARTALPVFRALAGIAPVLDRRSETAWGPAGSSAYELVTGVPAVRASSDLDLVFEADRPLDRSMTQDLLDEVDHIAADVRVDVQVETPFGAFALREWLRVGDGGRVALRTAAGPHLVDDPWATSDGVAA